MSCSSVRARPDGPLISCVTVTSVNGPVRPVLGSAHVTVETRDTMSPIFRGLMNLVRLPANIRLQRAFTSDRREQDRIPAFRHFTPAAEGRRVLIERRGKLLDGAERDFVFVSPCAPEPVL